MARARLILASGSPQRKELLSAAGYSFEIIVPDDSAECGICSTGGPAGMVRELAFRKADNVRHHLAKRRNQDDTPSILIACDTVAECNGAIMGKPRHEDHARQMLNVLRGQVHRVYSGLCIWAYDGSPNNPSPETRIAITELVMENVTDNALDEYLASGLWRGKAGAFGYQDRLSWLEIKQGSQSNVIGLPMELLGEMLAPWDSQLHDRK